MRILLRRSGEEKALGKLGCAKQSARHGERSTKHKVNGSERMKLYRGF